jgi:hypothetical protein
MFEAYLGFDLKLLCGGDLRQMDTLPSFRLLKISQKALLLSRAHGRASQTFPAKLGDVRSICVGTRTILLQMKF